MWTDKSSSRPSNEKGKMSSRDSACTRAVVVGAGSIGVRLKDADVLPKFRHETPQLNQALFRKSAAG